MDDITILETLTFEVVKLQNGDIRIYDCLNNILCPAVFISAEIINSKEVVLK